MGRTLVVAVLAALVVAAVPVALAATGPDAQEAKRKPVTLRLQKSQYGPILFDGRGRVLYAFTRDRKGKPSRCYGSCAKAWPVYFAPKGKLTAGKGVKKKLLGTTRRRGGKRQVTYNGWPLYYYAHEGRGEVKCHNVRTHGGLWIVMKANGRFVR